MLASVSTIMETNKHFQGAQAKMKKCQAEPSLLFQSQTMSAFEGIHAKEDCVLLLAALKEQEYIGKCLKKLIQSYNKVFLRQVQTIWKMVFIRKQEQMSLLLYHHVQLPTCQAQDSLVTVR